MKAFFEEYGLAIVIIIVVAALIALAVYVSDNGTKAMTSDYDNFTSKANAVVSNSMNQDLSSPNSSLSQ